MAHHFPLKDYLFISEFAAFCRTKGGEAYSYTDPLNCGLAQFLKATERWDSEALPCGLSMTWQSSPVDWWNAPYPSGLDSALRGDERNFLDLATRLEALLADYPVEVVK